MWRPPPPTRERQESSQNVADCRFEAERCRVCLLQRRVPWMGRERRFSDTGKLRGALGVTSGSVYIDILYYNIL